MLDFAAREKRRSSRIKSWNLSTLLGGRSLSRNREGRLHKTILASLILIVLALCYKLATLGAVVMGALALATWVCRRDFRRLDPVFLLGLAYVADATVTSFAVSYSAGVDRTAQFCIIAICLFGLYAYAQSASRKNVEFLLKGLGAISILILAHLIIWHLTHHHLVTWKYLADTKLILSLSLIPLFGLEDWMKTRGHLVFPIALLTMFTVLLLSGERKALMLFCILFALSRFSPTAKAWLAAGIAAVAGSALLVDDGYIQRQLASVGHDYSHTPTRYFFSVQSIYDQSDVIREFVNRNAWHLFQHHQQFGLGATGYWAWAMRTYGKANGLAMNVHGEIARVPVEGGLLGIAIALAFLTLVSWRALRHIADNGGLQASALDRTPLYCVILLLCYCYSEAVDTAMLLLIGGVGAVAGSLPVPASSLRRASRSLRRMGVRGGPIARVRSRAGRSSRPI